MKTEEHTCPLCRKGKADEFFRDKNRCYLKCSYCALVFVPRVYWLSRKAEKAVYDLHENDPMDKGYRRFLSRLTSPLLEKLTPGQRGLDFGCGSGPALAGVMEEQGHFMDLFDPYYYPDPGLLKKPYDFITATEVVEHLTHPDREFTTLFNLLNPGAWLGIMTKMVKDQDAFSRWHYIRDLTHVCFYSPLTFEYIAARFNAGLIFAADDVVLFRKANSNSLLPLK